ncbi:unnamed protein product [Closterium sp. NIES-65]|nr:unnamed protein product [Closterium sp. NIES-65]
MAILPSCLLSSAALPTRLLPSVIEIQESCFALVYNAYGLRLDQFHVDNLTLVSCWVPASRGVEPAASPAVPSAAIPAKPPLLLLHGFGASSLNHWINQLAAFSRHFDLYIPDLLFFRGSYSRDSRRDERFQAEAMIALMDRLGIQRCAVVGVSYGGIVAHKMATLYPTRVSQLVLGGPGLILTQGEVQGVLQHWHAKTPPDLFLPTEPSGLLRLIRLGNNEAPYLPDWLLQDALEVLFENREEKAGLLEASLREAQANAQHPEGIAVPSMPTLLVWGGSDQLFPLSIAHRMHRHFGSSCRLEVIEKGAHAIQLYAPVQFLTFIPCLFNPFPCSFNPFPCSFNPFPCSFNPFPCPFNPYAHPARRTRQHSSTAPSSPSSPRMT